MQTASTTVKIQNKKGLHARAAARFVKIAGAYEAEARVKKITASGIEGDASASAVSILGLMMLGADPGTMLQISAQGSQAQDLVEALSRIVQEKFGEE